VASDRGDRKWHDDERRQVEDTNVAAVPTSLGAMLVDKVGRDVLGKGKEGRSTRERGWWPITVTLAPCGLGSKAA
jgi:hypothetical protein